MPNRRTAIEVRNVSKTFAVPHEKVNSLKGHATRLFRKVPKTRHEILNDVSFDIQSGEFFSIIGENGSGKSTMLKLLAGIYQPTSGTIKVNGSLTTLIELGVGFNFDLSGRDNIYLNGSIIGLSKKQIEDKFDEIVSFAEIEEFIDQKVKNYSSGMQVRLAFSIAMQAQADIIIVDEVLAVGDSNFQQKCFDVFRELKAAGKTIIFVSHDLSTVREFSDRVLVLHDGKSHGIHDPIKGLSIYQELARRDLEKTPDKETDPEIETVDTSKPHFKNVSIKGSKKSVYRGDEVVIDLVINNPDEVPIGAGVSIVRNDGLYCFGTNTILEDFELPVAKQTNISFKYHSLPLQKGKYFIVAGVFSHNGGTVYHMMNRAAQLRVLQKDDFEGMVYIDHSWSK